MPGQVAHSAAGTITSEMTKLFREEQGETDNDHFESDKSRI